MDTKEKKPQSRPSGKTTSHSGTRTSTGKKPVRTGSKAPERRKSGATDSRSTVKSPEGSKTQEAVRKQPRGTVATKKAVPQRRHPATTKPATTPKPAPDVVYTPAKPFNRNRLLLRLTTVVAVVLALTFGISIFFKVDKVEVSGNQKYSPWTVMEASGIQKGDNLLTFGKARASGRITAALPYVESVRIGIKLPDTVNIEIKEVDVAYAIQDGGESWWLMTSEGRVVDQIEVGLESEFTQVLGVYLQSPVAGQPAIAMEPQSQTDATEESAEAAVTVPVTVTASDKLTAALSVLQYLEKEELFDNVVSVDVNSLGNIQLWYGQQYKVIVGDSSQLGYKIHLLNGAINGENGLKEYDSGILDITFTTSQGEVVIYEPFD